MLQVSIQHERAFACRLWAEASLSLLVQASSSARSGAGAAGGSHGTSSAPTITVRSLPPSVEMNLVGELGRWCAKPHCLDVTLPSARPGAAFPDTFTTCYAEAGGNCLIGWKDSVHDVVRRALKNGVIRPSDVVSTHYE